MAAGLAHELNNPASATARAVEALQETTDALLSSLVQLAERSLLAEQFIALEALRRELGPPTTGDDPLLVADREEAVADWLGRPRRGRRVEHRADARRRRCRRRVVRARSPRSSTAPRSGRASSGSPAR